MDARQTPATLLVTGGTRGIGLQIASAFAQPGSRIFLNFAHDAARARQAQSQLEQQGADCELIQADLSEAAGCARLGERVKTLCGEQPLNLFVHAAVQALAGPLLEMEDENLSRALNANGFSLHRVTRALLPAFGRGSSIVFVTSSGGRRVVPGYAAIGMGKALSECAMRYLATELAPRGIRINAISPSVTDTDALRSVFGAKTDAVLKQAADANPSGRNIKPDDFTGLVRWLASDEARFVQGQVITVNGGSNLTA